MEREQGLALEEALSIPSRKDENCISERKRLGHIGDEINDASHKYARDIESLNTELCEELVIKLLEANSAEKIGILAEALVLKGFNFREHEKIARAFIEKAEKISSTPTKSFGAIKSEDKRQTAIDQIINAVKLSVINTIPVIKNPTDPIGIVTRTKSVKQSNTPQ